MQNDINKRNVGLQTTNQFANESVCKNDNLGNADDNKIKISSGNFNMQLSKGVEN